MADNFNFKQFLMENKLGAYSKATLNETTDSSVVVIGSGDNFTTEIDGKEYVAHYDNHDEGDTIELVAKGDASDVKSGVVKRVSPDGDLTIKLDPTNDYFQKRKSGLEEKEIEDTIYGTGEDDDYDRKGDAERTGAKFVPHEPREPRRSNFVKPTSQAAALQKLIDKMMILNRVAIDNYKYAKKEEKPAAREKLRSKIDYLLGNDSKYTDQVIKGIEKAKGIFTQQSK